MSDILAFDPARRTNAQAIVDARDLGWFPGTVLDATYGRGGFWTTWRPDHLTTNDIARDANHVVDWTNPTELYAKLDPHQTVVFDPDYRLNGTPDRGDRDERYGTEVDKNANERMTDIMRGVLNLAELAEKFLLVKCQDQVSSGYGHHQMTVVAESARRCGFRWVDDLWVFHSPPAQRSQTHARRNASALMCLKRTSPKRWS